MGELGSGGTGFQPVNRPGILPGGPWLVFSRRDARLPHSQDGCAPVSRERKKNRGLVVAPKKARQAAAAEKRLPLEPLKGLDTERCRSQGSERK